VSPLTPTARVARGATYLFAQGFLTTLMGLVYFIFLAHAFSDPSEQWQMGAFALLSFILSLVQVFGPLALTSAAIKYIAQYLAEGDLEKARAVIARVLQVGLLASAVAFFALFLPAEWVSTLLFGTEENALLIRLVAVCSILVIINIEISSFLQGMQKMRDVAIIGIIYSVVSTSLGIYLLLLGWRLYAVASGWLVGWLISSVAGLILTFRYLGISGKPHPLKPLLNFSLPLYVSGGIGLFVSWIDQLLLVSYMSLINGPIEAQRILGIYYVAVRASIVPGLFSSAVVSALFPQLTELYAQQGSSSLRDAFRVSTRYSLLIGFPLIVGVATLAFPIIILFGGWQYIEAVEPLIIISISALIGTIGVAIGPILMTLERTRIASVLSVISVTLSFFLSYFALAYLGLGMNGTAWARTIASIIIVVLSLYVLSRYVSISIDREALLKASVASAVMVFAILSLDFIRRLFSSSSQFLVIRLTQLPIYVLVGAVAYSLSLVALRAVKKSDIELIEEYLPKNLKRVVAWLERFAVAD